MRWKSNSESIYIILLWVRLYLISLFSQLTIAKNAFKILRELRSNSMHCCTWQSRMDVFTCMQYTLCTLNKASATWERLKNWWKYSVKEMECTEEKMNTWYEQGKKDDRKCWLMFKCQSRQHNCDDSIYKQSTGKLLDMAKLQLQMAEKTTAEPSITEHIEK